MLSIKRWPMAFLPLHTFQLIFCKLKSPTTNPLLGQSNFFRWFFYFRYKESDSLLPNKSCLKRKYFNFFPGGVQIEYIDLVFNQKEILLGLSGIPDFKITLWNWVTEQMVFSQNLNSHVCFNWNLHFPKILITNRLLFNYLRIWPQGQLSVPSQERDLLKRFSSDPRIKSSVFGRSSVLGRSKPYLDTPRPMMTFDKLWKTLWHLVGNYGTFFTFCNRRENYAR